MSFRLLDPQSAESSEGFILRGHSRYSHEYVEGEHRMIVAMEPHRDPATGDYFEVLSEASLDAWQPPFESGPVSAEEHARIRANVSAALDFLRIQHRFEK